MQSTATLDQPATRNPPAVALHQDSGSNVTRMQTRCSSCNLRELCLPCGLSGNDAVRAEDLVYTKKRIKRGEKLYRAGDIFNSMYAIRSGFFKTTLMADDGREQVTAFHMGGEMLGMDGIGGGVHGTSAIALEDSEVCVMPYTRLQELTHSIPVLQNQFHKVMSREIVREHGVMMLLGSMRAEERLAAFLLNLSQRFAARGYSRSDFQLRMTREEIGSYLGLKLETVSRAFSKFQEEGLLEVQQKHVQILDVEGLRAAMGQR